MIIPFIVLIILVYGICKKVSIYDTFLGGAKEGLITVFNIVPSIIAMVFAINIFLKSGIVDFLTGFIKSSYPVEVFSMALLRPISGSATLAILNNVYKLYGVDSFFSYLVSVIQGCTDTTVYVLALYFGSVKISKSRYALGVGLFADLVGIISAFIIAKLFFY